MTVSCREAADLMLPHEGPEITVLSPVYMGEQSVPELVDRVRDAVEHITKNYEIVLVEDGSPDGSWRSIETACKSDHRVKGICLSLRRRRGRGQYRASRDLAWHVHGAGLAPRDRAAYAGATAGATMHMLEPTTSKVGACGDKDSCRKATHPRLRTSSSRRQES
jgi:hypothetical protein